jgi:hypothetical protein
LKELLNILTSPSLTELGTAQPQLVFYFFSKHLEEFQRFRTSPLLSQIKEEVLFFSFFFKTLRRISTFSDLTSAQPN